MKKRSAFPHVRALSLVFALLIFSGMSKGSGRLYLPFYHPFVACTSSTKGNAIIGKNASELVRFALANEVI